MVSSLLASISSTVSSILSSSLVVSLKLLLLDILELFNISSDDVNFNTPSSTFTMISYLVVIYLVVFWVVFIVVVVYRFYSNFIHLASCLEYIRTCHIERSAGDKLGKFATVVVGSGHGTRNSIVVGLLNARVRYVC